MARLEAQTVGASTFEVLYPSQGEGKPAALRSTIADRTPGQQEFLSLLTNSRRKGAEREASVLYIHPIVEDGKTVDVIRFQVTARIPQNVKLSAVSAAYDQFKLIQDNNLVDETIKTAVTPR